MKTIISIAMLLLQAGGSLGLRGTANYNGGGVGPPTTVTYATNFCGVGGGTTTATCTLQSNPSANQAIIGAIAIYSPPQTLTSVGDGTGAGGLTGSSSYTIMPIQTNSTNMVTYLFYACKYQGTNGGVITLTSTSAGGVYGNIVVAQGNRTAGTSCNDGTSVVINTSAGSPPNTLTQCQTPAITTTNANDLLIGFNLVTGGYGVFTPGTDGQGNTFTADTNSSGVSVAQGINETAANTYHSAGSWTTSSVNNCYVFAVR